MAREDSGPGAAPVAAWFGLRAEDRGAAAVALHALRGRAARIIAGRCRCGIAVADDHVADAYLCGVARNEWRWARWRRAREAGVEARRGLRAVIDV